MREVQRKEARRISEGRDRVDGIRKYWASLTPEQIRKRVSLLHTPDNERKRIAGIRSAVAAMTADQKRQRSKKAWETRRSRSKNDPRRFAQILKTTG
jgi:hypothetical protein